MNIKAIPFIIPNYNQLTYLRNLLNQIRFYYPENPIIIIDNASDFPLLKDFYDSISLVKHLQSSASNKLYESINVYQMPENDFVGNLSEYIRLRNPEYYVITDPDLSIHPATPANFLEIFKTAIDNYGFHHAGFGLITDDIPSWNPKAGWIQGDEKALLSSPVTIEHEGKVYQGFKAPIDTTFCLYKRDNGGWTCPMSAEAWSNSIRLFQLYHLPWYLNKDYLNDEMKNYFATCKRFEPGQHSSGKNNYRPE